MFLQENFKMVLRTLTRHQHHLRPAFTLLEVLIVVAILVILASAASIALFRYLEEAKEGRAQNDMRAIEQALKTYYLKHGEWPPEGEQGLALIAPYLEQGTQGLISPWGTRYYWQLVRMTDEVDGNYKERPVVFCPQHNINKPPLQWPLR
jgi:prepilin-type N-terminal cleavage/methylation domain-containing protein